MTSPTGSAGSVRIPRRASWRWSEKAWGMSSGTAGLSSLRGGAPEGPELAFELLRHAQGFGYATEAGGAVVAWATEAGYEQLWATVRAWNVASRRVLEKLGFRETGQVEHGAVHGDSLLTVRSLSSPA
ncbi:GNAT family N-acetyltransferase [Nocardioides sp.]|uniref:GNAT family N-acetyltransferase n=1 Tax=Nocardioides sp. TaxID=35761 RepID=UPI0034DFC8BA